MRIAKALAFWKLQAKLHQRSHKENIQSSVWDAYEALAIITLLLNALGYDM